MGKLWLAWHYLLFNYGKSITIILSFSVIFTLPLSINKLVAKYNQILRERAEATPLLMGTRGNRYDLVLKSLYFYTDYKEHINMADYQQLLDSNWGEPVPIHVKYQVQKFHETSSVAQTGHQAPLIGTQLNYFERNQLPVAKGSYPLFLGEVVVGAELAEALGLDTNSYLLTSPTSSYNQAQSFQLKMPVVGILKANGSPDDMAAFVDLKTAWVIDGIGHGHEDVLSMEDSSMLNKDLSSDSNLVTTAQIVQYQEITGKNRAGFHFHGNMEKYPISSVVFYPKDKKSKLMSLAFYNHQESRMLISPLQVMDELMGFVFKIRQFINANYLIIYAVVAMLIVLIFFLSVELRENEFAAMARMGGSRKTVAALIFWEIFLLLSVSLVLSVLFSLVLSALTPWLLSQFFI